MGHGVLVGAAKLGTEVPIDIGTLLLAGIRINQAFSDSADGSTLKPVLVY